MFFRYINDTRFGFKSIKQNQGKVPLHLGILENLRCHKLDEYPVISIDDEVPVPPLACSFNKGSTSSHILALVDENGSAVLYNTNLNGDGAIITDWCAHNNAVFDVEWTGHDNKLLTASGDQTIALWDVTSKQKLLTFKGHTSSVRSVRYRPNDDAVFASGSRDGHVRIWDSRCNVKSEKVSCVNLLKNAHSVSLQSVTKKKKSRTGGSAQTQDCQQSVTCVLFQNDNLLTTSGAVDGCVKVWDMRKMKQDNNTAVYSFPYVGTSKRTHGFSSLVFDSYYSKLYANCTDDVIYCYDFVSYDPQPVCSYKGHRNTSFYVKSALSPDNEFLLSGSSDEFAYIWQVSKPNASPVLLKGHGSEISDVAWCKTDLFRVVTTSDDNTMRVWRYDPTAELRQKLGRSDVSCDIVGSAERTHRDIGTCVEQRPGPSTSISPARPAVKRAATVATFGPVVVQSPKQAKTNIKLSASPSIKMWLKRSASDSQALNTDSIPGPSSGAEQGTSSSSIQGSSTSAVTDTIQATSSKLPPDVSKTNADSRNNTHNHQKKVLSIFPKSEVDGKTDQTNNNMTSLPKTNKSNTATTIPSGTDSACNKQELSPSKRPRLDFGSCKTADITNGSVKKSCKRKLVEDVSPKKSKRSRPDDENMFTECKPLVKDNKDKALSPLKDLNSVMNKSPEKCDKNNKSPDKCARNMNIFSSPARGVLQEWSASVYQSPTANLPNIVVDGPQRKILLTPGKSKTVDWLTQMRNQRRVVAGSVSPSVSVSPASKRSIKLEERLMCSPSSSKSLKVAEDNIPSAPSTPKSKSPPRGVRSITSFFSRQLSSKS